MSRANSGPNNAANRSVGGHIKEGLKNIPKMYDALYNAKGPNGQSVGVAKTVGSNVRTIATGKGSSVTPVKTAPAMRAKMAVAGVASVTPLGPIAAVALGINKSVQDQKAAVKAKVVAAAKSSVNGSAQVGAKSPNAAAGKAVAAKPGAKTLTPQQQAAQKKAANLKKTLNEAMPGLNMR